MHRRPRPRRARRWQIAIASLASLGVLGLAGLLLGVPASGKSGVFWANRDSARVTPRAGRDSSRTPIAKKSGGKPAGSSAASAVAPTPSPTGSPTGSPSGAPFDGVATVGALFQTDGSGKLQSHFCTATVVDSPAKNTIITAAHCIGGASRSGDLGIAFAPGYHDGKFPYGVWTATRFSADSDWSSSSDPDHDVGFLQVSPSDGSARKIQDVTGAVELSVGHPISGTVRVIGYPDSTERPISCQNGVSSHSAREMEFDCPGYENGTSGGPFVATDGSVIGVIGGYQEGGLQPDVSYSATFTSDVHSLYTTAIS
jgi:V8-like Glu-specific endopeptidase